jgi:hypothetical protein
MKKATLFLTLCILACAGVGSQNLINNGDMENSAGWNANVRGTNLQLSFAPNEGVAGSIALKLAMTQNNGDFYVVLNNTFFSVTQNTSIKITFSARATTDDRAFTPFLQTNFDNSFTNFETVALTTEYQEYTQTVEITSSTSDEYRLRFRGAGGAVGEIFVDNVTVELVEGGLSVTKNDIESMPIYPNPTNDYLHINEKHNYEVFNMMGQKVMNGNSEKIDVRNLDAGVYIIAIDNRVNHRFIKR